ncbi:MAG: integrase [Hyphomicrobium sp. 32-62-53]|nr:MAG: integrase [Hyphomicrobium sp. 12-62-95]OYX99170.1 MAG: integrase [Hyphomicrobium sp. 32-62-53]
MARMINRLSDRTVRTLTAPGLHADGGNLFLVVDPPRRNPDGTEGKPAKRWAFVFQWNGKRKEMGLGGLNSVSLAAARDVAAECRAMLAKNINPIEARRAEQRKQAAGRTFGDVAKDLHKARKSGFRNKKSETQWLTALEAHAKPIWDKSVESIGTEDVLAVLQPVWTSKSETAARVRGRIEAVLDAARARGLIDRDRANPARWKGHLSFLLPKRQKLQRGHHAALPYGKIADFMTALRGREAMAGLCLEFTILTAVRSGEAMHATWGEVDLDAKLWVIPRERMKRKREHRVPLSDRCVEMLAKLEKLKAGPDSFVFPGTKPGRPLSVMALEMLLRRMKVVVTVHGFRSTFRDWAGDCTNYPREIVEEALAHQVGSEVERAYRRGDAIEKRRQLMEAWSAYCGAMTNVVVLRTCAGDQ